MLFPIPLILVSIPVSVVSETALILVASVYPRSAYVCGGSCGSLGGAIFDLKVNINIRNDKLKS